jgi:NAD(P)-dependent dehydrogenase (short-subunit alcohol dehydrogenase family)
MRRTFQDRVVLVTGASRGIGRRIAGRLAARGAKLALVGRTAADLQDAAREITSSGGTAEAFPADLTDPQARSRVVESTAERFGGIDGLVNAAGVAAHGPFESGTEQVLRAVMEINFFATAEMTRLVVPHLIESASRRRQPVVMNVASVVGRFGFPGVSEHSASKHALIGLTESLRCEFVRYGIDVLVAAPSVVKTDDMGSHLLRNEPLVPVDFDAGMDPDAVAEQIVVAMERNKDESYLGRQAWWVNLGRRMGPRVLRKVMWRKYGVS